ncbi:MAG: hypothetical protein ACRCVT_06115 [Leadbetterella sp.]
MKKLILSLLILSITLYTCKESTEADTVPAYDAFVGTWVLKNTLYGDAISLPCIDSKKREITLEISRKSTNGQIVEYTLKGNLPVNRFEANMTMESYNSENQTAAIKITNMMQTEIGSSDKGLMSCETEMSGFIQGFKEMKFEAGQLKMGKINVPQSASGYGNGVYSTYTRKN